jgi:DNA polymerase III gamma/tau subunit
MHAYLIVGKNQAIINIKIKELSKTIKANTIIFPLAKIEDVRNLNAYTKLTITEPTLIVVEKIELATTEALNALLKNLEEPQANLFYILVTDNQYKILPTIISRCEVIKLEETSHTTSTDFFILPVGSKFAATEKIKKRDEALVFVENLIDEFHQDILKNHTNKNYKTLLNTYRNLNAYGNVQLQLTNMIVNLV